MQKIIFCILAMIFFHSTVLGSECKRITINGSDAWIPVSYREDARYIGIIPSIVNEIFTKMNIEIEVRDIKPWKRILFDLKSGKIDLLTGAYFNEERAKIYQYTDALMEEEIRVFVKKGREFPLAGLADLKGKKGVLPLGGSYGQEFDDYAKTHLTIFQSQKAERILKMLKINRVDYAVWSYFDGLGNIKTYADIATLVVLPHPLVRNGVHAMFSKNSPCLSKVKEFNQRLAQMKEKGEIQKIVDRYIQKHF